MLVLILVLGVRLVFILTDAEGCLVDIVIGVNVGVDTGVDARVDTYVDVGVGECVDVDVY